MTRLETQVLDLLREDCRLPLEKLAVMLGVSTEEVAETIDSHPALRAHHQLGFDRP